MAENYIVGARKEDIDRVSQDDNKFLKFDTAKEFLRNTKVSALFPKDRQKILTIKGTSSVAQALNELVEHKILSLPVFDEKEGTYNCFIDMLDVVNHIVDSLKEAEITGSSFTELLKTSEKLSKVTCSYVGGLSGRNPYYPIDENAPLLTAIQLMADNKVHRIPVIDKINKADLITIITQSHVADLVLKNISKFPIKSSTVQELNLGLKEVVSISKNKKAIEAFHLIHSNKISGISVVDDEGGLIGNISASDIKLIGAKAALMSRLYLPIEQFLKFIPEPQDALVPGPYCVTPTATFEEILTKMVMLRIHRLYIINEKRIPVGVISFSDILQVVVKNLV